MIQLFPVTHRICRFPQSGSPKLPVLLVEDQAIIAMGYQEALQDAGIKVIGPARSAAKALELAAQTPPSIALVDLEISGNQNGIELARVLKERWGTTVVFVSGYPPSSPDHSSVAVGFLSKPFTDKDLVDTVSIARKLNAGERSPVSALPDGLRLF